MAKKFVKISLATKFRLLLGTALLVVIAAALVVPWYFVELLAEQSLQRSADELTRLRLNEWVDRHPGNKQDAKDKSEIAAYYSRGASASDEDAQNRDREGPAVITLTSDNEPDRPLDASGRNAQKAFLKNPDQKLAVIRGETERGRTVYYCYRAMRMDPTCMAASCHGPGASLENQRQSGQLVGMIKVTMPPNAGGSSIVWWARLAFLIGGGLAALLATIFLAVITQRLILRPVRKLRQMSEKVAEGDLTVRSDLHTRDELQLLGERFNEMLEAISDQHNKLRSANRAADLKLNELAEANVTLFQANKVKTEFLTNVSHELRTPLNSIIGFAELLSENADERVSRYSQNIATASRNLLNMINDLLDLAKIEAGRAQVRIDKVSLTGTCQTMISLMQPQADKKQIALNMELDEDLPLITTDGGKLQQILYNLLANAIKFTPVAGQVTLSAKCNGRQAGQEGQPPREVSISVADTGPGISEADQKHVFEKFYQADATLTKKTTGTGLGLAISKELSNLLGGRLTFRSSPGNGTVFTLTLPVNGADDNPTGRGAAGSQV